MNIRQAQVKQKLILLLGALMLSGAGCAVPREMPQEPVACTEEAKLCPDGSAVGRTGPNCEFAKCPEEASPKKASDSPTKQPPKPPSEKPAPIPVTLPSAPVANTPVIVPAPPPPAPTLINGKTVEQRLAEASSRLHTQGSGAHIRNNFPDIALVYTDNAVGKPFPSEILPFRYYYSSEANTTFNICAVDLTVFICKGKLDRLVAGEDVASGRCEMTSVYGNP